MRKQLCDTVRRCVFDVGPQWTTAHSSSRETRVQFGQLALQQGQQGLCSVVRVEAHVQAPKDVVYTRFLADPRSLPTLDMFIREVELVMQFGPTSTLYDFKVSTPTGCRDVYAYCTRDTDMFSGELLSVWRTVRVDPTWARAAAAQRHHTTASASAASPEAATTDASPLCARLFLRHHTRPPLSLREVAPWARWCRAPPASLERRNCGAIEVAAAGMLVHDDAEAGGGTCVVHVVLAFSAIGHDDLELFTSGVHGVRMMENIQRCVAATAAPQLCGPRGLGAADTLEARELDAVLAEQAERLNDDLYALLMTPLYEDVWVPLCKTATQLAAFRLYKRAHGSGGGGSGSGGVLFALRGYARGGDGDTDVESWIEWVQRRVAQQSFLVERQEKLRSLPHRTSVQHVVFAPEFAGGRRSECVLLCRCRTGEGGTVAKVCFRSFEVFQRVRDLGLVQQSIYPSGLIVQQDGTSVKMHYAVVVGMNTGTLGPRITATQFLHETGVWLMTVGSLLHAFTGHRLRIDIAAAAAQVRAALAALVPADDAPAPPSPRCLALMRTILDSAFEEPATGSCAAHDQTEDDEALQAAGAAGAADAAAASAGVLAEDPVVFVRTGTHTLVLHRAWDGDHDTTAVNERALRRLLPQHKRQRSSGGGCCGVNPGECTAETATATATAHSLDELSDEAVTCILAHCTGDTLLQCLRVSRRVRRLAEQPCLWRRLYERLCVGSEVLECTARAHARGTPGSTPGGSAPDYRAACAESQHIWRNWGRGCCATERVPAAAVVAPGGHVSCLALLEAHGALLTGGTDRAVRLWRRSRAHGWSCVNTFAGGRAGVAAVARAYDAVAAAYRNGEVRLWSLRDWALRARHRPVRQAAGFVLDAAGAVLAWDETTIRVLDPATLAATAVLAGHTRRVVGVAACTGAPQALFSCAADRTLRVWDRRTGRCELAADILGACPSALAVSPVLNISTGAADGTVHAWDLRALDHGPTNVARLHSTPVHFLKYGYGILLSTAEDRTIGISERLAVHHLHSFNVPSPTALADFSNRRIVVSTTDDVLTTLSFDVL